MSEKTVKTEKKVKSIFERWSEWIRGKSKTRPSNTTSYGKGMEQVTITLPKSVEEQLKLVNMMQLLDTYPNDYKLKMEFFNEIAKHGTTLNQPVSYSLLGYAGVELYITMYCDLLLRPLSLGAADKIEATIMELLPSLTEPTE